MEGVKVSIANLQEGTVLAKDLFVENRLFMRKGSFLTSRIIDVLKNRNIRFVHIESNFEKQIIHIEKNNQIKKKKEVNDTHGEILHYPDFTKTLALLNTEMRYGNVLKNQEDIIFLRDLFNKCMANIQYRELLIAMKQHDFYTYLHSVDVFTLATLFAQKEGLQNIESLAIGFLFHDIGKLKTPIEILQKKGRLSKKEFSIIQQHTQEGFDILCDINLSQVAYLAKSHHEQIDGLGYPEGLTGEFLSREVLLLQLLDIYSAITLKRPYKSEMGAAEALAIIYQDRRFSDKKLLERFIDFIGIYPENAIVQLSDGSHALVEKVNNQYPLLPTVKKFDASPSFILPVNFQLKIDKIISYNIETPEQLFNKFSEYLLSGNGKIMENYYYKLLELYTPFEWFAKIYIPIYQIFRILKDQSIMCETRINEVSIKLKQLLDNTVYQLCRDNKKNESMLLLVEKELQSHVVIRLLEGILYMEGMYPFILDLDTKEDEMLHFIDYCNASTVFVISKEYKPIFSEERKLNVYHVRDHQLESLIINFADEHKQKIDITVKLKKYEVVQN